MTDLEVAIVKGLKAYGRMTTVNTTFTPTTTTTTTTTTIRALLTSTSVSISSLYASIRSKFSSVSLLYSFMKGHVVSGTISCDDEGDAASGPVVLAAAPIFLAAVQAKPDFGFLLLMIKVKEMHSGEEGSVRGIYNRG